MLDQHKRALCSHFERKLSSKDPTVKEALISTDDLLLLLQVVWLVHLQSLNLISRCCVCDTPMHSLCKLTCIL